MRWLIGSVVVFVVGCAPQASSRSAKLSPSARIVQVAKRYTGVPYRWGGMDQQGMDCSGLVCRVYWEVAQMRLPRTADALAEMGKAVPKSQLHPGDLVFFREPKSRKITHVGIVTEISAGEVRFIHASTRGGVREDSLDDPHWRNRYVRARRLLSSPPSKEDQKRSDRSGR